MIVQGWYRTHVRNPMRHDVTHYAVGWIREPGGMRLQLALRTALEKRMYLVLTYEEAQHIMRWFNRTMDAHPEETAT